MSLLGDGVWVTRVSVSRVGWGVVVVPVVVVVAAVRVCMCVRVCVR